MTPVKRFSDKSGSHRHARVIQAWLILIGRARNREPITYTALSELMLGKRAPRSRAMRLGQLYTYCKQRELPLLPVIVVTIKSNSTKPADLAPYDSDTLDAERERVYDFNWFDLHPPTETELNQL